MEVLLLWAVFLLIDTSETLSESGPKESAGTDKVSENQTENCASVDSAREKGAPVRLDRMVVRARRLNEYRSSVKTITGEEIEGIYNDLPSVLEQAAGLTIQKTGGFGEYAQASVRGGSARQVRVFVDGVPLNSANGAAVDISKISLSSIDKIQIYKGAAPLEFMTQSSGAVINIVTVDGSDAFTAAAGAGSWGYRSAGALLRRSTDRSANRFSVDFAHSDNDYPFLFDNNTEYNSGDDSVVNKDNNGFTSMTASYGGSFVLSQGRYLKSHLTCSREHKEIFTKHLADTLQIAQRTAEGVMGNIRYEDERKKYAAWGIGLKGLVKKSLFEDPLGLYYLMGEKKNKNLYPKILLSADVFIPVNNFLSFKIRSEGGYEGYSSENLLIDSEERHPEAQRFIADGAGEVSGGIPGVFNAALRYNHIYVSDSANFRSIYNLGGTSGQESSGHFSNGNFDFIVTPAGWLSLNTEARYEYQPTGFYDRFGWGSGYIGNEDLKPEKRMEISAGFSLLFSNLSTSVNVFTGRTDDEIEPILNSQKIMMSQNIGDIEQSGVEWELSADITEHIRIENAFHIIDKEIVRHLDARFEGNIPPLHSEIKDNLKAVISFWMIKTGHTALFRSPFYLDVQNTRIETPQPVLNAFITLGLFKRVSFTYRIENYLDEQNSYYPSRAPMPGRAHYFTCRMEF